MTDPRLRWGQPETRLGRRIASLAIAGFVLLQIAIPLRYYVGHDPNDERFAWRMFSSRRMQRCQVLVRERDGTAEQTTGHPVALARLLPEPWLDLLRRGDSDVVAQLLRWRCGAGAREVVYERRCRSTLGAELPAERRSFDCSLLNARP